MTNQPSTAANGTPLTLMRRKFLALDDLVFLRDPGGRSPRPRLRGGRGASIRAHGPFLMHQDFVIARSEGRRFVEITGDPNPIHREGDVAPGAMTMSKALLPIEVVAPAADVLRVNVKFTSVAFYGERMRNVYRFEPAGADLWRIEVTTYQAGRRVAKTAILCRSEARAEADVKVRAWRVNKKEVARVREFCDALRVNYEGYLERPWGLDYTYPLSFVASLPSGAIVEQMAGEGGLLNSLSLDFEGLPRAAMSGRAALTVQLERKKPRKTFNKILASIVQGIVTYCKGHAIVHPDAGLALSQIAAR